MVFNAEPSDRYPCLFLPPPPPSWLFKKLLLRSEEEDKGTPNTTPKGFIPSLNPQTLNPHTHLGGTTPNKKQPRLEKGQKGDALAGVRQPERFFF